MLRVIITNDKQRREFTHEGSSLTLGRSPASEQNSCIIEDAYVSREQLQIEELPGDKLRLDNVGRNVIMLADGTTIAQGESKKVSLPAHVSVGRTVLDVVAESNESKPGTAASQGQTLFINSISELPDVVLDIVCNQYPYPLAFGYRLLSGITNPAERYREQLRTVENMVALLGTLSLAAVVDTCEPATIGEKAGKPVLDFWRGGISPGGWLDLAIHALNSAGEDADDSLVRALKGLELNAGSRGFGKIIRQLIKAKNDHKHDRGPGVEEDYREQGKLLGEDLRRAFDSLSFLVRHPILLVQDINPQRRSDKADVLFLKCCGDHPGFSTEKSVHSANLRKGDLYIRKDDGRLASLYPFMVAKLCGQCKAREFFYIDRLDKNKQSGYEAGLKSFERGHTDKDLAEGNEMAAIFAPASE